MKRLVVLFAAGVALWLGLAGSVFAQGITGTIPGAVTYKTGAVLPGVTATIRNAGTDLTRSLVTDGRGRYEERQLPIGPYKVKVDLPGFGPRAERARLGYGGVLMSGATRWRAVLTAPAVPLLASIGGHVQATTASPTGSIAGLTAKFVDVKGVKTRYYEAGQGEPMVLVHGEGWSGHSSANTWSKNIPGLAKRFHVFAADKLASGMTGNPLDDKDYNIQGEVEHMYQFIQTMKLGKVHLVGQSRGGGLVFFLSVAHPEIVRTLVIVDSNTASPDTGPTDRQLVLSKCPKEPDNEEWKCRLRAISFKPEVAFDEEFWAAGFYMASLPKSKETIAKMKAGAGEPLASQFNEWKKTVHARIVKEPILQMPTLFYWGRNDPSAMLKNGLALYDVIAEQNPNLRMIIANKAGHFHYREYPAEFNQNVINFIDYWRRSPAAGATAAK